MLVVTFPADEGSHIDVPIPIVDDTVDEAKSQYFYAIFETLNVTNPNLVDTERTNSTLCDIRDNDSKYYNIIV